MTDAPLTHETIEQAFSEPKRVISRLPDTIESREARRLVDVAERLTHEVAERVEAANADQ